MKEITRWERKSFVVHVSSPRTGLPLVAPGLAAPGPSPDRCWADEPGGQQCAATIDEADLLGLCDHHRLLFRDEGEPVEASTEQGSGQSKYAAIALEVLGTPGGLAAWQRGDLRLFR